MTLQKPVLLFDGDCGFCRRWAESWRILAEGRAEVEPYQSRAHDFPEIPAEEFKKSVYFFEPVRTSRAAEAVFRLLAYSSGNRFGLWCYEKVPGFRFVSEKIYSFVAGRRAFFSKLTNLFWGSDPRPDSYFISRRFFFHGLAAVYASAFISLGTQILGLIGSQGISPVKALMPAVFRYFKGFPGAFLNFPTVFWASSGDFFLQAVCAAGALLSLVLFAGFAVRACLFILWFLYLSLVSAGQDFLSFQWDILLLETGFLALFWAPRQKGFLKSADWDSKPVSFSRALLFFLLFKLMLSSGLVKLASGDDAWRGLTALSYHFETQPLPNPLSWFAHQLPAAADKGFTLLMFFIEIGAPLFLFFPRNFRRAAALMLIFLQILILLTGNYCFFNFLTIFLCLTALDDLFWTRAPRVPPLRRAAPVFWRAAVLPVLIVFFLVGTNQIARIGSITVPWTKSALRLEKLFYPLHSLNNYGLFAVMTKKRPEILIEGSNDGNDWKVYGFKYKPGIMEKIPGWAAPHQPRLDWQMWFAALSSADRQPWFVNLCTRILMGSGDVLNLLADNPFPEKPPLYIRASIYRYQFTTPEERRLFNAWWKKDYLGLYLPPITLDKGAEEA